jgi:hypothetical protein
MRYGGIHARRAFGESRVDSARLIAVPNRSGGHFALSGVG